MSVAGPQRQKTQIELEIGFVKFAIGELMADSLCALSRRVWATEEIRSDEVMR